MSSSKVSLASFPTYTSVSSSRLKSLYSDFSLQKQSNPAGFQSNVEWWHKTLLHLLRTASQPISSDVLILHANNFLLDGLSNKELGVGKPLGIGAVLTELSTLNVTMPLNTFLNSVESIYYTGSIAGRVASYLVGRPLWWALKQLNIVGEASSESDEKRWKRVQGNYIFIPLLEEAADAVLKHYDSLPSHSLTDTLYDLDSFRAEYGSKLFPDVNMTIEDTKVLLKFLERDRKVLVCAKGVIKFVDPEHMGEPEDIITPVDQGVLEMKLAVGRLHAQVEDIQRQIEEFETLQSRTARIIDHLKQKRKELAMSYLRSRKELEGLLSKRLRSLETIQSTLLQVESAAGDIEIMKAYETSTATLKNLLSHPSLQREKVDETLEAMAEAAADHAEIDKAIRLGGETVSEAGGVTINEDELQEELQQMIEEKEREEAERKALREVERAQKERERQEQEKIEGKSTRRAEEDDPERTQGSVEERTGNGEERVKPGEKRWLAEAEQAG
ncbi:hypothetical protein Clacol_005307 [Clathrus columnatus]|uniref:Charged multivesicular body protein 7 n=1 Tax=Clathrus columnatus TaxID=1419009 RepID=A0AAV5AEZ4_9AGAM|nr:hypothetical protein Clacol_005307 [Clathrus columnatus]